MNKKVPSMHKIYTTKWSYITRDTIEVALENKTELHVYYMVYTMVYVCFTWYKSWLMHLGLLQVFLVHEHNSPSMPVYFIQHNYQVFDRKPLNC